MSSEWRSGLRSAVLLIAVGAGGATATSVKTDSPAARIQEATDALPAPPAAARQPMAPTHVGPAEIVDSIDPTYGSKVRQLRKDDGHEHNLYYYRDVWNADGARMLGIQSNLQQQDWRVCLYDGAGVFLKELFPISQYDWRLCWDRHDPDVLYTWRGSDLYRFHVTAGKAELLKSFAPLGLQPNGPSCNQAGDRILVVTSDKVFHSYHLPDMTDERTFQITVPPGCFVGWDKPHYTGYRNYIDTAYNNADSSQQAIVVYDDTGAVVRKFDTIGGGGHYDWSPDGKLAYFRLPTGGRGKPETPFEIHVVNLDGSDERVLFTVPRAQAHFSNLHLSWPAKVNDWFVAGFYPMSAGPAPESTTAGVQPSPRANRVSQAYSPPQTGPTTTRRPQRSRVSAQAEPTYEPPYDEILLVRLDGTTKYLARTGTVYSRAAGRGQTGDMFWAQTLPSPSADGKRICFNSCRSGTIDLYILFPDVGN